MRRVHVLPREQEPHEVGRADRLDFRAQPVQRVAMDARQQPPVAPLNPLRHDSPQSPQRKFCLCVVSAFSAVSASKCAPQHDSLGFERQQRRVGVGLVDRQRSGERLGRRRPEDGQAAAQQLANGLVARPRAVRAGRRRSRSPVRSLAPGMDRRASPASARRPPQIVVARLARRRLVLSPLAAARTSCCGKAPHASSTSGIPR